MKINRQQKWTHLTNEAVLMPLLVQRRQHLLILNRPLATGTLGLVQLHIAFFAVRPPILHDKRLGEHRGVVRAVTVERLGVNERVAALGTEEVQLVVEPLAEHRVVERDVGLGLDGGLAVVASPAKVLSTQPHQS